jgi:hypothetical protein
MAAIFMDEKKLSVGIVDKAYLQLTNSNHFNTWEERLSFYSEEEKGFLRSILDELSKSKDGMSRNGLQFLIFNKTKDEEKAAAILSQLLERLKNDGYIMRNEENKYVFRSPLLRDSLYNRFIN